MTTLILSAIDELSPVLLNAVLLILAHCWLAWARTRVATRPTPAPCRERPARHAGVGLRRENQP